MSRADFPLVPMIALTLVLTCSVPTHATPPDGATPAAAVCDEALRPTELTPAVAAFLNSHERVETITQIGRALPAFLRLAGPERQRAITALIERGRAPQAALWNMAAPKDARPALISAILDASPKYGLIALDTVHSLDRETMLPLIERGITNARLGDAETVFASAAFVARPAAIQSLPWLARGVIGGIQNLLAKTEIGHELLNKRTIDSYEGLTAEDRAAVFKMALQHDPLSIIMVWTNSELRNDAPLHSDAPEGDLAGVIRTFAAQNPELFPEHWLSIALDLVETREMAFGLIRELYRLSAGEAPWILPDNAIDLIARAAGLDFGPMAVTRYTRETRTRLLGALLQTQARLTTPAYRGVPIAPELLHDKRLAALNEFFTQAKYLLFLRGDGEAAWQQIRAEHRLADGLTPANIGAVTDGVRAALTHALEDVLKRTGQTDAPAITLAEWRSLEEKWLDTDVLFTLVARFNANPGWRPEIKILAKLIRAEIDGHAAAFKRFGDPNDPEDQAKARAQTAMLKTEAQQAAWWREWSEAAVHAPNSADTASLGEVREIVRRSTKSVVVATAALFDAARAGDSSAERFSAILDSKLTIPKTLNELGLTDPAGVRLLGDDIVAGITDPTLASGDVQKAVAYLKYLVRELSIASDQVGDTALVNAALNDALKALKPIKDQAHADQREIVVTVTAYDTRTMLSLGGIVQAGSCMHPEYGERGDAIPAPAIDANIQAILSTALDADDFATHHRFAEVAGAIAGGAPVGIAFDGLRDIYRFTLPDGRVIPTNPVTTFFRRHQMKLGATKRGQPVIRTERAFTQFHGAQAVMETQTKSIKARMARAAGGVVDVGMQVPASRNVPGGTYSDAMMKSTRAGQTTGAFFMPFVEFDEARSARYFLSCSGVFSRGTIYAGHARARPGISIPYDIHLRVLLDDVDVPR